MVHTLRTISSYLFESCIEPGDAFLPLLHLSLAMYETGHAQPSSEHIFQWRSAVKTLLVDVMSDSVGCKALEIERRKDTLKLTVVGPIPHLLVVPLEVFPGNLTDAICLKLFGQDAGPVRLTRILQTHSRVAKYSTEMDRVQRLAVLTSDHQ
jgi:hypothetical protein